MVVSSFISLATFDDAVDDDNLTSRLLSCEPPLDGWQHTAPPACDPSTGFHSPSTRSPLLWLSLSHYHRPRLMKVLLLQKQLNWWQQQQQLLYHLCHLLRLTWPWCRCAMWHAVGNIRSLACINLGNFSHTLVQTHCSCDKPHCCTLNPRVLWRQQW